MGNRAGKMLVLAVLMGVLAAGCAPVEKAVVKKEPGPVAAAYPGLVVLDPKSTVAFMGSGFTPGKKVNLIVTTTDGIMTNLSGALDKEPTADKQGGWSAQWRLADFIKSKLVAPGVYTVKVMDEDYNLIAHVPVTFIAPPKKEEKKEEKKKEEKK